jgi:glycosyltransferase involved in cell wall biosynthesis
MHIVFDYQTFALQTYGGISRYFTRLAQGLLDMEQRVEIFAPLHRNSYLKELQQGVVHGRHIKRFPPKTARLFLAYNQFRSYFQLAGCKPDVVHETYYSKMGLAQACPTVITVHDMVHELIQKGCPDSINVVACKRKAISRADHVICISENTKSDLMRIYNVPDDRVSVVHHGFDQFVFSPPPPLHRGKLINQTKPYILYVGQRSGYKNFEGFLAAVARSHRLLADFNIIAFGGPRFSAAERTLMASLGFSEDQIQHKTGNDESLGGFYRSARAFVYPSLYEGFGIPPLEAMAQCCPVVSSNTSSMPEVIGCAGEYFDPHDLDDMRCTIEGVVYSDERIQCLRQAGTERLLAFSWAKCAGETLDVYRSLA